MDFLASVNFLFFISTIVFSIQPLLCDDIVCDVPFPCSLNGPLVQFPFWMRGQQDHLCGYEGFEVWCDDNGQTILNLPASGEFVVKRIDYIRQAIFINDPDSCLPKRMQNFSFLGSPFRPSYVGRYRFVNCSSNLTGNFEDTIYRPVPMLCVSGRNHTVYAVNSLMSDQELPPSCADISSNDSVSYVWSVSEFWSSMSPSGNLKLVWSDPRCWPCAARDVACGMNGAGEVGCIGPPRRGLPRSAKYGIVVGALVPILVFIIALAAYGCDRVRANSLRPPLDTEQSATIVPQPIITAAGLNRHIIESLPKTVLGESGRLPKPNDATCPICLCEYQPKETLRTIPECNHYFHADCIDEWLKLNGTCPLCRNSPDSLSMTSCSLMSSSTSLTSS